jgi:hypothetical protein
MNVGPRERKERKSGEVNSEEVQNLYSSPSIKMTHLRWLGLAVRIMKPDNLKGRVHLVDLSIDGRIILKCMLKK